MHNSPPKIHPPRLPTHSLNADRIPDAEGSGVCCSLPKRGAEVLTQWEATRKISEENPICTSNLEDPCKQAPVPSDSIHTATETGFSAKTLPRPSQPLRQHKNRVTNVTSYSHGF